MSEEGEKKNERSVAKAQLAGRGQVDGRGSVIEGCRDNGKQSSAEGPARQGILSKAERKAARASNIRRSRQRTWDKLSVDLVFCLAAVDGAEGDANNRREGCWKHQAERKMEGKKKGGCGGQWAVGSGQRTAGVEWAKGAAQVQGARCRANETGVAGVGDASCEQL